MCNHQPVMKLPPESSNQPINQGALDASKKPTPWTKAAKVPAAWAPGKWSSATIRLSEKNPPRPNPARATQTQGAALGARAKPAKPTVCSAIVSNKGPRRSALRRASIGMANAAVAWNIANQASRLPEACRPMFCCW